MDDIDGLLGRLRDLPIDPRLSAIDDAVLDGVAKARRPALSGSGLALVALASLTIGLGGTLVPAGARTAGPQSALVAPGPLAPSTLLGTPDD
jgi:hypothetical protein